MEGIEGKYAMGDIEELPHVLSTRDVYKSLESHRPSTEMFPKTCSGRLSKGMVCIRLIMWWK